MITIQLFYLINLLPQTTFSKSVSAYLAGNNFVDNFKFHEYHTWQRDLGTRHCGEFGHCAYSLLTNVQYEKRPLPAEGVGKLPPESEDLMIIRMMNNCAFPQCCEVKERCTSYTSAHLSSREEYGFGSFEFLAKVALNPDGLKQGKHDALSCFALRKTIEGAHDNLHMDVSMCFPSNATNRAILSAQYGTNRYQEIVKLPYDAGRRVALYRIEWHVHAIEFFVNTHRLASVIRAEFIPDMALKIQLMLVPRQPLGKMNYKNPIEQELYIFLARFTKSAYNEKNELFVLKHQYYYSLKFWIAFLVVTIFLSMLCIMRPLSFKKSREYIDAEIYETILDENHSSF